MLEELREIENFANHLRERGLDESYSVWIDWNEQYVWFPLWVPFKLVGYQRYAWKQHKKRNNGGKYFTWIQEEHKPIAMWGYDYLNNVDRHGNSKRILIVEGVWDAIRCMQAGYNALAVLTASPSREFVGWFNKLTYGWDKIGILDNDDNQASCGLIKLCNRYVFCRDYHDIADYPPEKALNFLTSIH